MLIFVKAGHVFALHIRKGKLVKCHFKISVVLLFNVFILKQNGHLLLTCPVSHLNQIVISYDIP